MLKTKKLRVSVELEIYCLVYRNFINISLTSKFGTQHEPQIKHKEITISSNFYHRSDTCL